MATKTLTRNNQAETEPVETEGVQGGYTGGYWMVRGNRVELSLDAEWNIEEAAKAIVEDGLKAEINREIAKIAALPPFAQLRSLRERIAEAELTINAARGKSEELKSGLGPDASAADVGRVKKGLDDCNARIQEATLQRDNARRFTADAFAECDRLARESRAALEEVFRDRAAEFVKRVGDAFWEMGRKSFLQMSIGEQQTQLVDSYIPAVMASADLVLEVGERLASGAE